MTIKQYTYISTASRPLSQHDIDAIVAAARRNNLVRSVTGYLVFNGLNFLQTLEGAPADVDFILAKITADDRHTGLRTLQDETVATRLFSSWAMGYREVPAELVAIPAAAGREALLAAFRAIADMPG